MEKDFAHDLMKNYCVIILSSTLCSYWLESAHEVWNIHYLSLPPVKLAKCHFWVFNPRIFFSAYLICSWGKSAQLIIKGTIYIIMKWLSVYKRKSKHKNLFLSTINIFLWLCLESAGDFLFHLKFCKMIAIMAESERRCSAIPHLPKNS